MTKGHDARTLAGRYRLVERIDRGGTAEVWRAPGLRPPPGAGGGGARPRGRPAVPRGGPARGPPRPAAGRIEGRPVTGRTDVYGLALVAYELLAGQPAFAGAENEDLLRDRLERGAPHPRAVQPSIADNVDLVVAKGLAREPEGRYPTAGAFPQPLSDAADDQ